MKIPFFNFVIESTCRTFIGLLGLLISPSWPVARQMLSPYLDLDRIVNGGPSWQSAYYVVNRLNQLDHQTTSTELLPALLLCLSISIGFVILFSWLGGRVSNRVLDWLRPQPVAEA